MALCTVNFFSKELENYVDIMVLYPTPHNSDVLSMSYEEVYKKKTPKTLYLLHGMLDDYTSWLRGTGIERYAEAHGLCVVMPSGQNAFYSNNKNGLNYFNFVTKELPAFVESTFGVSDKREDRFIAGLSMGGYGAMKAALTKPEQYSAVGSFSGAVDIEGIIPALKMFGIRTFDAEGLFGGVEKIKGSEHDIFKLLEDLVKNDKSVDMYIGCGTEDPIVYQGNVKFEEKLMELEVEHTHDFSSGAHEWDFWETQIRKFIQFLYEKKHLEY